MSKQVGVSIICPECKNQFYPSWLRHLQSAKKRMFYAMLPCIALLIFVDLNGEAPRAPSVTPPAAPDRAGGYDYLADVATLRGLPVSAPTAVPLKPTPPVTAPPPSQPAPPVTAPRPSSDVDAVFNEVMGQRGPNAASAARVQQALGDAEGKKPEEKYDYLALLDRARAAERRGESGQIVLRFLVMAALAFALLTLVHTAASMYKPWSMLSKPFRMYWFFSACWVFAVTLFVMVFDPYKIGGLSEMGTDQYSHMFSIAFVIPIFIGLSFYVYQRYVK